MIAPEPVFEPRGTPFSVVGRLKALSDMGHQVDLVTYPMGKDIHFQGVKTYRIPSIPGIKKIKIGPSLQKIPLDFLLIFKTLNMLLKYKYDIIHTHEEAGFWGTACSHFFKTPHIYDMHSSLPQQLTNFQFTKLKLLITIFERLEAWVLKNTQAVITICTDLYEYVQKLLPGKGSVLIENVIDYGLIFGQTKIASPIRRQYNLQDKKVALYCGTFEAYQGLDMLIQSAEHVLKKNKSVRFLMVGGHSDQVKKYRKQVQQMGLSSYFIFTGQVQPGEINQYIQCSDILLSPRTAGTNTPLKVYSYLRSGVPIVATRLLTHTQVMNDDVAVLTNPTPEGFTQGILSILKNTKTAREIVRNAQKLAEEKYSYSMYLKKFSSVLQQAVEKD